MRGRIAIGDGAITSGGNNPAIHHNHGPDGHFAAQRGGLRLRDGQMHVFEIVHGCVAEEAGITYSTSMTSCSPSIQARVGGVAAHFPPARGAAQHQPVLILVTSTRPMSFRYPSLPAAS